MQINWHDSGHAPDNSGRGLEDQLKPFPAFIGYYDYPTTPEGRVGRTLFDVIVGARRYLDEKVQKHVPCNDCFRRLPGKRSFAEVYNDPDLWVNYNDAGGGPPWGFQRPGTKEIALHARVLTRGYLFVAATLVHEMAHVNGASGSKSDQSAESTLKSCLLAQHFDPNVFGVLDQFRNPGGDSAYA